MHSENNQLCALLTRTAGVDDLRSNFLGVALAGGQIGLAAPLERHRPLDDIEKLLARVPMPWQLSVGRKADSADDDLLALDARDRLAE